MAWVKNGTPNTLTVAGDDLDITDLTAKTWNTVLSHVFRTGNVTPDHTLDNETGDDYAVRRSFNDGADTTSTSQADFDLSNGGMGQDYFSILESVNISGAEKLFIGFDVRNTDGASNAPNRQKVAWKKDTTTSSGQYTRIDNNNSNTGNYLADSNISVLGEEGDEVIWDRTLEQANTEFIATDTGNSLMHDGTDFSMGGWKELGRAKLSAVSDNIDVSNLPNKRYYMVLGDFISSGVADTDTRFNDDSGTNYAQRRSFNGSADSTEISATVISDTGFTSRPYFSVSFIANLLNKEKLMTTLGVDREASGAGIAPSRSETVGKWANTTETINKISKVNGGAGDHGIGSEVVVLGYDPTDIHSKGFWEELASVELSGANSTLSTGTFTAKKYLWVQMWHGGASGTADAHFRVGNSSVDTGSNYSVRFSINGGADSTQVSSNRAEAVFMNDTTPEFVNMFIINNASNEKLGISHQISQSTAGAANTPARQEGVFKWANTSNQINIIEWQKQSSQTFPAGSFIRVWGHD